MVFVRSPPPHCVRRRNYRARPQILAGTPHRCENPDVLLYRLATIRLLRPPPSHVSAADYVATNGVPVATAALDGTAVDTPSNRDPRAHGAPTFIWPNEHKRVRVGVWAVVPAGPPDVIAGQVQVPQDKRLLAEEAIDEYADILAVTHQCRRVLRSPIPCVGMAPEDEAERIAVGGCRLQHGYADRGLPRVMLPSVTPEGVGADLADRRDGIGLLADALSEDTPIGRVREILRLFERAFSEGPSKVTKPLATFLASGPWNHVLRYTEDEARHWLQGMRGFVVHADRRGTYARSRDVEPYVGRMEYAAYDVLFNKATWRDRAPDRRVVRRFTTGVSPDGTTIELLDPNGLVMMPWLDPYGSYPVDHESTLTLPEEWIVGPEGWTSQAFTLRVGHDAI